MRHEKELFLQARNVLGVAALVVGLVTMTPITFIVIKCEPKNKMQKRKISKIFFVGSVQSQNHG